MMHVESIMLHTCSGQDLLWPVPELQQVIGQLAIRTAVVNFRRH